MKFKFVLIALIMFPASSLVSPANADEATAMCESSDSYISAEDLSCDPEDYGVTFDTEGNMIFLESDFGLNDGPTIQQAPDPEHVSTTPPRTLAEAVEEGRILTGSVSASALYFIHIQRGLSHEEAMNRAMLGSQVEGMLDGATGKPHIPAQHHPRRNTGSEYYPY